MRGDPSELLKLNFQPLVYQQQSHYEPAQGSDINAGTINSEKTKTKKRQ
jgi:hypothetical protein